MKICFMPSRENKDSKDKKSKSAAQAPSGLYINRDVSWLAFNRRVLLEAADPKVPLLERLKFLMIYQSNLEEFYRVRIGILSHRALLTPDTPDPAAEEAPDPAAEPAADAPDAADAEPATDAAAQPEP